MERRIGEQHHEARRIRPEPDLAGPQRQLHQRLDLRFRRIEAVECRHRVVGRREIGGDGRQCQLGTVDPFTRRAETADRLVDEARLAKPAVGLHRLQGGDDLRHQPAHHRDIVGKGPGTILQELHVQRR